jgi:hypothetical protein
MSAGGGTPTSIRLRTSFTNDPKEISREIEVSRSKDGDVLRPTEGFITITPAPVPGVMMPVPSPARLAPS